MAIFFKPVDMANKVDDGGIYAVIHFWADRASHDASDPRICQQLFLVPLAGLNVVFGQKDGFNLVTTVIGTNPEDDTPILWPLDQQDNPVDPNTLTANDRVQVEQWDRNITEEMRQNVERFIDRHETAMLAGQYPGDSDDSIASLASLRTDTDVRNLRGRFDPAAMNGYDWRPKAERPDDFRQDIATGTMKWSDVTE